MRGAGVLIASPRHTARDLERWAELIRVDRVLAASERLTQKTEKATLALRDFLLAQRCYLGVSWGKDSVVVAHIAAMVARAGGPVAQLVWVRVRGIENPDCPLVRDAFLARFAMPYDEIEVDEPEWRRGPSAPTKRTSAEGFAIAAERYGDAYISGVRGAESAGRRKRMTHWGTTTKRTCAPIGWWQAADVYAYLERHDLPVHPAYACLGGGLWDREWLRVSSLGGERGTAFGRAEWERTYYGDVVAKTGGIGT